MSNIPYTNILSVLADNPREGLQFNVDLKVPSRLLKAIFSELQPIMLKTAFSKVISFRYKDKKLSVIASTTMIYNADIPISGDLPEEDCEISCMYENLSEILPTKGDITLTITPMFVSLKGEYVESNLSVANDEVPEIPLIETLPEKVTLSDLKRGLKNILSLTAISNIFKTGNVVIFSGDYMQMRYPTIWIQTSSSGLHTLLDYANSTVLNRFLQNAESVEVYHDDSYVIVKKEYSQLFFPRQKVNDVESMEEFLEEATFIDTVKIQGLAGEVQSLLRTVKPTDARVVIFKNYIRVEVTTDSITAKISCGEITDDDDIVVDTFVVRLEFLNNFLPILGDYVKLYRKGDWVCLKGQKELVITSSL